MPHVTVQQGGVGTQQQQGLDRGCLVSAGSDLCGAAVAAAGFGRQSSTSYRSPLARDDSAASSASTATSVGSGYRSARQDSLLDSPTSTTPSSTSRYGTSTGSAASAAAASSATSTPSSYTSRFLNKSKSTAAVDDDDSLRPKATVPDESTR